MNIKDKDLENYLSKVAEDMVKQAITVPGVGIAKRVGGEVASQLPNAGLIALAGALALPPFLGYHAGRLLEHTMAPRSSAWESLRETEKIHIYNRLADQIDQGTRQMLGLAD